MSARTDDRPLDNAGWVIAGLLIITIVVIGGWRFGWWFTQSVQNHQNKITRGSYSFQTTLRDTMTSKIADVATIDSELLVADPANVTALHAQRTNTVALICQLDTELQGDVPRFIVSFTTKECPAS